MGSGAAGSPDAEGKAVFACGACGVEAAQVELRDVVDDYAREVGEELRAAGADGGGVQVAKWERWLWRGKTEVVNGRLCVGDAEELAD